MSSRFTRHGVPGMTSRQPSQRIATLSLTIVRIVTPMSSIADEDSARTGARSVLRRRPGTVIGGRRRASEMATGVAWRDQNRLASPLAASWSTAHRT